MRENNILPKPKMGKKLKRRFKKFLEYHPAKRVNRSLREVFMIYIRHTMDAAPLNIDDIIWDISDLMELLDVAEDETRDRSEV